jgi:hypothetical protein
MNILVLGKAKYTKRNFSLLRSKIRELPPVHRASLEALLRHLLHVSSHSDKNGMSVKELSTQLCYNVLGGDEVCEGEINLKVHCIDFCNVFQLIPSEEVFMEDLIQNAHALFDDRPSQWPQPAEVQTMGYIS